MFPLHHLSGFADLFFHCSADPLLCCADGEEDEGETDVAGIPDFWLHVLQSHKGWSEEVSSMISCPLLSVHMDHVAA